MKTCSGVTHTTETITGISILDGCGGGVMDGDLYGYGTEGHEYCACFEQDLKGGNDPCTLIRFVCQEGSHGIA